MCCMVFSDKGNDSGFVGIGHLVSHCIEGVFTRIRAKKQKKLIGIFTQVSHHDSVQCGHW